MKESLRIAEEAANDPAKLKAEKDVTINL